MHQLEALTAISPIDGRYHSKTAPLADYFSEFALFKYRTMVEVEYFIALAENNVISGLSLDGDQKEAMREMYINFSPSDAQEIKDTERVTNHDVKAVEYFVKKGFEKLNLHQHLEFVHFGLTSQDINNTAVPMSIQGALEDIVIPELTKLTAKVQELAHEWKDIPMLAKTHGQPASPTRLGKEFQVFSERLNRQLDDLKTFKMQGKFGGATGNFNAHHIAFPEIDWVSFANTFMQDKLGLERQQTTTQIEHYDGLAYLCHTMIRINTILIDFNRDVWQYIAMDYFKQKIKDGEVGSSAMPHKVNPIDFENAEGNLGIANCLFDHFSIKLPISRLQRDLTDSTVLRNIGSPFSHVLIAAQSTAKGLGKLVLNRKQIDADLERNWAVVAEAIQTILRREGYPKPYEALKGLTRTNSTITQETLAEFIDSLSISDELKNQLKAISPYNYTGVQLVNR